MDPPFSAIPLKKANTPLAVGQFWPTTATAMRSLSDPLLCFLAQKNGGSNRYSERSWETNSSPYEREALL